MIHPHVCQCRGPDRPDHHGPGAVDTVNALSSLAMTAIHSAITATQVVINRAVWGDCPPAHDRHNHHGCSHGCGCGYRNIRFHDNCRCC